MNELKTIEASKKYLDTDPHLANFMLRDLNITKEAGLSDLAWAMHNDGSLHKNDVLFLIELLEKHIEIGIELEVKGGN